MLYDEEVLIEIALEVVLIDEIVLLIELLHIDDDEVEVQIADERLDEADEVELHKIHLEVLDVYDNEITDEMVVTTQVDDDDELYVREQQHLMHFDEKVEIENIAR